MIVTLIMLSTLTALLLISVISLFARTRKLNNLLVEHEKTIKEMTMEVRSLLSADIVFGKGIKELNEQITSLDKKIEQLENHQPNDGGYQHALRILEMGGNKEEIIKSCHLTNAEAELLMNLNAYRVAAN
jgi:chromosome segregation ATPase